MTSGVTQFADLFGLGMPELLIILVILLLLIGAKKLPELAKSLGTSVKELRKGMGNDVNAKDTTSKTDKAE